MENVISKLMVVTAHSAIRISKKMAAVEAARPTLVMTAESDASGS
jgi:hypothetical protein